MDEELGLLAKEVDANIVILSEYPSDGSSALLELSRGNPDFKLVPEIGCKRIKLLITFDLGHLSHGPEASHYSIKELRIPGCSPLLFCSVHLMSKLHSNDYDQLHGATRLRRSIEEGETLFEHSNTIAIGDFNMNPFDPGMVSASALNAVSCLRVAERKSRTVDEESHNFFYNPTWNLLGDFEYPSGTYYHGSPRQLSHFWNTLEQVILRPSIARSLIPGSLRILTSAGQKPLLCSLGRPTCSDHLPITFSLRLT